MLGSAGRRLRGQVVGIDTCPASLAVLLNQPSPALVPAERAGDGPATRQAAVGAAVGVCPLPGRLCRSLPADRRAIEAAGRPADRALGDTSSAACAGGADVTARRRDGDTSAAARTWRICSSYEAISANEGHAAITRQVNDGSATATFAARLAALPATRSTHGRNPPRLPRRESASSAARRRDDHPVDRQRREGRDPARLTVQLDQQVHVEI
jgi:hypothetical protein